MAFRYLAARLALVFSLFATPALAAPQDAVFNKEGVWGIDVDHGACAASMILPDGSTFLLRGADGEVNVALFARAKLKKGKAGRIETDAGGFDFRPGWSETGIYTEDFIGPPAVAILRAARQVRIVVDGRPVMEVSVAETGFADAVDGVIACSKGQSGWWGKGVQTAKATPAAKPEPVLSKEGIWSLVASDDVCSAVAKVEGGAGIVLIAANDGRDIVVGVGVDEGVRRGRKGTLEADGYRFDFKPSYDGKTYMQTDRFLDTEALLQLRRATSLRVGVDGAEILSMQLEGTGFEDLMKSLAACGRGDKGWWGEGAKAR
jgi:hypothetical protein